MARQKNGIGEVCDTAGEARHAGTQHKTPMATTDVSKQDVTEQENGTEYGTAKSGGGWGAAAVAAPAP